MELLAAKKPNFTEQARSSKSLNKKNHDGLPKKNCIVALRIDTLLYNTLHNYLSAMHNVSDYTFSSVSDILRHILLQIENGTLPNKGVIRSDNKTYIDITIRVNDNQKKFWSSLPNRLKRMIMEKAIVAFTQKNK
jgi:hypothetical protein